MIDLEKYRGDNFIQTCDLTELLDEADAERQSLIDAADEAEDEVEKADLEREVDMWNEEYENSLEDLRKVCGDLPSDETCVSEHEIDDYLEEIVNDCYEMPKNLPDFITLTIDYDMLKQDYFEFDYLDTRYYVRCS